MTNATFEYMDLLRGYMGIDSYISAALLVAETKEECQSRNMSDSSEERIYEMMLTVADRLNIGNPFKDKLQFARVYKAYSDFEEDFDWETMMAKTKISLFCARLCNSCDILVQAYRTQNQETFIEAQQRAFDFFGGVPRRVIFDNAKVAVKEGFGLYAKPQDKYLSFSAHYAFTLDFCNPAKGNEKGLVENLVGYARRNFFVPVPRVDDMKSLNEQLWQLCLNYRATHKVAGRNQSVSELYAIEKEYLNPIPRFRFDTSKTVYAKVDDFSIVRYEKNNYSVPTRYIRKEVTIKGYADEVFILYEGKPIATYQRSYGSGNTQYRLEHYIDLLERKSRAVFNAKPVRDNITKELLDWGKILPGGNKEMVKLLRLCLDYGEDKILSIKRSIPSHIIPTVDIVRSCLNEPLETPVIYLNQDIEVLETDLTKYDRKFGVVK
jgi:hypothetical protein